MKIVATSDTHFPFDGELLPQGDVLIHAGDLMYSGYPDEWYARVDSLAALDYRAKVLTPGNHDFHIQNYNGIARVELRRRARTKLFDHGFIDILGLRVLAIPYVTGLPGWAYSLEESELERYLDVVTESGTEIPDVVVSHGPMYKTLDAINPDGLDDAHRNHVGSWAIKKWFDKLEAKPMAFIHGHIHESYGQDVVDGCNFYNVAMCDRKYKQNQPGMVIIEL